VAHRPPISKRLVELMGASSGREASRAKARVLVHRALERSARSPRARKDPAPAIGAPDPGDLDLTRGPPSLPRGSVLVRRDNVVNQKVAARILDGLGYTVDVASTGNEAVAAVGQHTYDAILMDGQMPQTDGFEATRVSARWRARTARRSSR